MGRKGLKESEDGDRITDLLRMKTMDMAKGKGEMTILHIMANGVVGGGGEGEEAVVEVGAWHNVLARSSIPLVDAGMAIVALMFTIQTLGHPPHRHIRIGVGEAEGGEEDLVEERNIPLFIDIAVDGCLFLFAYLACNWLPGLMKNKNLLC